MLVIDNPNPDTIAEQINLSAPLRNLRPLARRSPLANIEWVSLDQLHARCEEWSPKRKALIAATCDQDGVDLFYNID